MIEKIKVTLTEEKDSKGGQKWLAYLQAEGAPRGFVGPGNTPLKAICYLLRNILSGFGGLPDARDLFDHLKDYGECDGVFPEKRVEAQFCTITKIDGAPKSGKTTKLYKIVAEASLAGKAVGLIDAEMGYNTMLARLGTAFESLNRRMGEIGEMGDTRVQLVDTIEMTPLKRIYISYADVLCFDMPAVQNVGLDQMKALAAQCGCTELYYTEQSERVKVQKPARPSIPKADALEEIIRLGKAGWCITLHLFQNSMAFYAQHRMGPAENEMRLGTKLEDATALDIMKVLRALQKEFYLKHFPEIQRECEDACNTKETRCEHEDRIEDE